MIKLAFDETKLQVNSIPDRSNIKMVMQRELESVNQLMLSQISDYHPALKTATELILMSGGKRLRPRLILLVGYLLNAPRDRLLKLAASFELLHTATLVHDDLIDGAEFRRSVPTLNSKWPAAATVLTGDFVFASAAHLGSMTDSVEVMSLFAKTLMTMVNGEINQFYSEHKDPNREDYFRRIYSKTASLFETSTRSAAVISQCSLDKIELMRKFGFEFGMAFQIVDDILDYRGNGSLIGKPVGVDLKQGIITLPAIHFMEMYPNDQRISIIKSRENVGNDGVFADLVNDISNSPAIDRTIAEANDFRDRALQCLFELPESNERNELIRITSDIVDREL